MREKELRLALVCFGGVSLAVYMHGICTEILKLVRASAALHAITDRSSRAVASFANAASQSAANADTEPTYFDLLQMIGRNVELRVIVDIIAGASAGGINGTMLARALCHDLPIDRLSDLWLDKADVHVLLAPEARAGRWSKLALKPLIWGAASTGLLHSTQDLEMRNNLSLFVRSRWFKPPFDGGRMTGLMLDAINALGPPIRPAASLIPSGQRLDLFVTLTDYYGRPDLLQLHDPTFVYEREHRHVLHLGYRREILVDRISPADAVTLGAFAGADKLKGSALGYFAAFFSRSFREHDYLLGRLHAMDRLIDIVCDAAGINGASGEINIVEVKKRGFSAILQAEKTRLSRSSDLKAALRLSIMML